MVDEVFPIERTDVLQATVILDEGRRSARDALHVAVMRRRGWRRRDLDAGCFERISGVIVLTE